MFTPTLGQFIEVAYGPGRQVARVERVTAKRIYYRRLTCKGTPAARWADTQTAIAIGDPRIIGPASYQPGRLGFPEPPTVATFDRRIAHFEGKVAERRREHERAQASGKATPDQKRWAENDYRRALNVRDKLRAERVKLVIFTNAIAAQAA